MKTFLRIVKWLLIVVAVLVIGLVIAVYSIGTPKFDAPFPNIHASTDSSVIARGKYLVYGPAHCNECHISMADFQKASHGEEVVLSGGFDFKIDLGHIYSRNITSDKETGIGNFTDEEIARSLRYGVGKDGRALFAFMPFNNLSDEDLTAVISYLRTLPPVKKNVQDHEFNFLGKAIRAFMIKPTGPEGEVAKKVVPEVTPEYGKYLAQNIANCRGCHTNRDLKTGAYIGEFFSGGFKMESALGNKGVFCVTPNLTPDPKTGHIYDWTEERFIKRFRTGTIIEDSPMPWGPFSHFSDDDLRAIYMYIKTLKPVMKETGPLLVKE